MDIVLTFEIVLKVIKAELSHGDKFLLTIVLNLYQFFEVETTSMGNIQQDTRLYQKKNVCVRRTLTSQWGQMLNFCNCVEVEKKEFYFNNGEKMAIFDK